MNLFSYNFSIVDYCADRVARVRAVAFLRYGINIKWKNLSEEALILLYTVYTIYSVLYKKTHKRLFVLCLWNTKTERERDKINLIRKEKHQMIH